MRVKTLRNSFIFIWGLIVFSGAHAQSSMSYSGDLITTRAVMQDLAELYAAKRRGNIEVSIGSTSDSLVRAASGEIDLGGTARTARVGARQETAAQVYPIAWDALVAIVHLENPLVNLELAQLIGIYQGEITNWSEVGGNNAPIEVIAEADQYSGVNYNMTELLLGKAGEAVGPGRKVAALQDLEQAVQDSPNAIAITSYSGARSLPIKILSLDGIPAATQTITNGSYLLYMPLYLASRANNSNRRGVRDFLKFVSGSDAKRILRRNGVVPYSNALALVSNQLDRSRHLSRLRSVSSGLNN